MKHAAFLILGLGLLLLAATLVALLGQEAWEPRRQRAPETASVRERAAPELEKTRATLRHLHAISLPAGRRAFLSDEMPDLFPSTTPPALARAPVVPQRPPVVEAPFIAQRPSVVEMSPAPQRPPVAEAPSVARRPPVVEMSPVPQRPPAVETPFIAQAPSAGMPAASGEYSAPVLPGDAPGQQLSLVYFSQDFRRAIIDGGLAR